MPVGTRHVVSVILSSDRYRFGGEQGSFFLFLAAGLVAALRLFVRLLCRGVYYLPLLYLNQSREIQQQQYL